MARHDRGPQDARDDLLGALAQGDAARRERAFAEYYWLVENDRRAADGRDLLPPPEVSPEDERSDIVHFLSVTIPSYRRSPGWRDGKGKVLMDAWEDQALERLAELEKGESE